MRLVTVMAIAGLIISVSAYAENVKPHSPWKDVRNIDKDWDYAEVDSETMPAWNAVNVESVDLPHTWNAIDASDPAIGFDYRRAISWYRKEISFSGKERGRRLFLRFGAAGQQAEVYFNGHLLGEHKGGYTAFTFEITDQVHTGKNLIAVKVSNSKDNDIAPLEGDFTQYGGLYRSVHLIAAPDVNLSRKHRGGPGVRVWSPSVNEKSAKVKVSAMVDNSGEQSEALRFVARLRSPRGKLVAEASKILTCGASSVCPVELSLPTVTHPQLWTPDNPELYELAVRLYAGNKLLDETVVHHGFRWFRFDAEAGFFLNGQPLRLRGVNRHQDYEGLGNALPSKQHLQDIEFMKEMGANYLRLAHYPQDDYILELCDRLGLLVWEEIPWVKEMSSSGSFATNCESQLREMIEQHFNHPSVLLWGISNELLLGKDKPPTGMIRLLERLDKIVHEEDPIRLSVLACHKFDGYVEHGLTTITDVIGYNLYYGWYYNEIEDLTAGLEAFHRASPAKPLIVSEYGPGADISIHSSFPGIYDFSQEWQVRYHEGYLDQFEKLPWLAGSNVWNMETVANLPA